MPSNLTKKLGVTIVTDSLLDIFKRLTSWFLIGQLNGTLLHACLGWLYSHMGPAVMEGSTIAPKNVENFTTHQLRFLHTCSKYLRTRLVDICMPVFKEI